MMNLGNLLFLWGLGGGGLKWSLFSCSVIFFSQCCFAAELSILFFFLFFSADIFSRPFQFFIFLHFKMKPRRWLQKQNNSYKPLKLIHKICTKSYIIIIRLIILRKAYNMFYNNASEMLYCCLWNRNISHLSQTVIFRNVENKFGSTYWQKKKKKKKKMQPPKASQCFDTIRYETKRWLR